MKQPTSWQNSQGGLPPQHLLDDAQLLAPELLVPEHAPQQLSEPLLRGVSSIPGQIDGGPDLLTEELNLRCLLRCFAPNLPRPPRCGRPGVACLSGTLPVEGLRVCSFLLQAYAA